MKANASLNVKLLSKLRNQVFMQLFSPIAIYDFHNTCTILLLQLRIARLNSLQDKTDP